jgi:leader peptidase (prepilin peptidase)/N-methyltransferase
VGLTLLAAVTLGVLAGPWLRGLIAAHSVAFRQPLRTDCVLCGTPVVAVAAAGIVAVAPLNGRCPRCRHPVGPVPGSTETVAAAVLAAIAWDAPSPWLLTTWALFAPLGIALAGINIAVLRLPDPLTIAATVLATSLAAATAIATGQPSGLLGALLGAAALGALYAVAVRHGMGRGDAYLAVAIGANLGAYRFSTVVTATVLAILLAGATSAVLLAAGRLRRGQPIPYGVFLLTGALAAVLLTTTGVPT